MRRVVLWLLICVGVGTAAASAAERPRVYVVLVDGLDASLVNDQLTPTLWQLIHGGRDRTTFYPQGRSVMPTVTNTNHAALMTAAYAAAHGIVGNFLWDRSPTDPPEPSEQASNLEVETLFTVIEKDRPALRTAGIFGKFKLAGLFGEAPGRQKRPDILWADIATETEPIDRRAGFNSDQRTIDVVLQTFALEDPDFVFTALPDVDLTSHLFGPDSNETRRAVLDADRQIGRLVDVLKRRKAWERTVLIVTADHGFQSVTADPAAHRPYPLIFFGRELLRAGVQDVTAFSNGGVEFVAFPGTPPQRVDLAAGERLKAIRTLALAQPEIAEAWYRLPNPADGDDAFTLDHVHPDWRLTHPRVGELILVAQPHYSFGDPYTPHILGLAGDHGAPGQSHIPILITGGDKRIRTQTVDPEGSIPQAANPDIGATAAWLLGVRMPRTLAGKPVPPALAGRVLREAFQEQ
jgi:type I phosphodiesterase/nucleotide pyrophosphatase